MIKLELDQKSLDEINAKFDKLDTIFKRRAIAKLADMVYEKTDDLADTHTQTGEMIKSLFIKKRSDTHYEVGFDDKKAPHAKFVHFGSRAHDIRPRNRKFLRWVENSAFVFSKKAHHPGYKGDPFLYNALNSELNPFLRWIEREIANATN